MEQQKQKDIPNIYTVYRDKARKLDEAARQRSPLAMGAGELVGAIGTGGAAGVRSIPALMGEGALYGFGSSQGDALTQLQDAGEGALTALVAGGAGKGLEKLGAKITSWLGKKGQ